MKLFHSPTSPYVRKVVATAIACGYEDRIELVDTNPHTSPPGLIAANPLSKVPCLVTEDGLALFDSPVICEYIDAVASGTLFPAGAARWSVLRHQAIGDGMMDAAVARRMDQMRPQEAARDEFMARQATAVARALDMLEADLPPDHLNIGTLSIACSLGYLDLRFATDAWREGRPGLAAWYTRMEARPELARTKPPGV